MMRMTSTIPLRRSTVAGRKMSTSLAGHMPRVVSMRTPSVHPSPLLICRGYPFPYGASYIFESLTACIVSLLSCSSQATTKRSVEDEVSQLTAEWRNPRWAETTRPYTAKDVVALRGSLQATYPADAMSKKLYQTLLECKATGGHSRTYGALDPVQVTTMAPHLTSIYVSGWQSSSTASTSNEVGPDFADYPMDSTHEHREPYTRVRDLRDEICARSRFVAQNRKTKGVLFC